MYVDFGSTFASADITKKTHTEINLLQVYLKNKQVS